jgi:hypothetical protein
MLFERDGVCGQVCIDIGTPLCELLEAGLHFLQLWLHCFLPLLAP